MSDVFYSHEINFEKFDVVFNVLTKKCCLKALPWNYIETEQEGHKLYEKFIKERIVGSNSI